MRSTLFFCCFFLCLTNTSISQPWTASQLELANTAGQVGYLTTSEKEVILYINLCRLFPQQFAKNEVELYVGPEGFDSVSTIYKTSLLKELAVLKRCKALQFDKLLYDDAKCYSAEISKNDRQAHERINCPEGKYAECISFGIKIGREIALQLLIDEDVESLGHRRICLDSSYNRIGVSANTHFEWNFCAVAEFIW